MRLWLDVKLNDENTMGLKIHTCFWLQMYVYSTHRLSKVYAFLFCISRILWSLTQAYCLMIKENLRKSDP